LLGKPHDVEAISFSVNTEKTEAKIKPHPETLLTAVINSLLPWFGH
jgi:hypothetical protein